MAAANLLERRPMRIALISPKGPLYRHRGGIWKKSLRYMPLTLTTLAALVPEELRAEVRLLDEGLEEGARRPACHPGPRGCPAARRRHCGRLCRGALARAAAGLRGRPDAPAL